MSASEIDGHAVDPLLDPRGFAMAVRKWYVIDLLRRELSARELALVITPTTSPDIVGRPELLRFASVTTLQYQAPGQRLDPDSLDRLPGLHEMVAVARRSRVRADIVFVDPWHTYDDSMVVLLLAMEIVRPGGRVVVHDCYPCDAEVAAAEPPPPGSFWCGCTWQAFADLTARLDSSWGWRTVDADVGIGVIEVPQSFRGIGRRMAGRRMAAPRVRRVPSGLDDDARWAWFETHGAHAVHLEPWEPWYQRYRSRP